MEYAVSFWKRKVFFLVVILILYPSLTQQELAADSKRVSSVHVANGDESKLSTLIQQGISTSEGFRHSAVTSAGNVTMDSLSDSLARLEDNLSSLIQSFLTVQRSVFNLEQLQELLVLLLEDILKQTGKTDKIPTKDTNQQKSTGDADGDGADGGGSKATDTSMINDSHESDSSGTRSTENENGTEESEPLTSHDAYKNVENVNEGSNDRITGSNIVATGQSHATHESIAGLTDNQNIASTRHDVDTSQVDRKDDSGGDSSEGINSNSNENYPGQRTEIQRSTQAADIIPLSSSQKPQWSEPMMERTSSNTHPRFYDVVNRIASRLGQQFVRKQSPRLLGLMQMSSAAHVKQTESTFERSPAFEPLEVLPVHRSSRFTERKIPTNMSPLKDKPRQELVISHGGPLVGPEQFSSMFLEHPETYNGIENTGERSTGMINDLVLSNSNESRATANPDEPALVLAHSSINPSSNISVPDIRRKRHAHKSVQSQLSSADNIPSLVSPAVNESGQGNENLISKDIASSINVTILNTTEKSIISGNKLNISTNGSVYSNSSQKFAQNKHTQHHDTESSADAQEYDGLIASLLIELSSKLHQHQMEPTQHKAVTDDISQAGYELNKLIWIPLEHSGNEQSSFNKAKTEANNKKTIGNESSLMSQGMPYKTLQAASPVKTRNLSDTFSETLQNSIKMKHSAFMSTKVSSNHGNTNVGDKKWKSVQNGAFFTQAVTSNMTSTLTPNTDIFVTEEAVTALNSGSSMRNLTNNTSTEWEWLFKLIDGTDFPMIDRKWLIDTLTFLSLNESIVDNLTDLNERGRALLEKKSLAGELKVNVNTRTTNEMNTLIQHNGSDDYGDTQQMARDDNSKSSDEDYGESNEQLISVGNTGSNYRRFYTMSKLDTDVKGVKDRNVVNDVMTDADSSEESNKWNRNSESYETNDGRVEGRGRNGAVVQDIGDPWIWADYSKNNYPNSNTDYHINNEFQDPSSGLTDYVFGREGQVRYKRSEFAERHRRANEDIINDVMNILIIPQEKNYDQISFDRQKRQVSVDVRALHRSKMKSSTGHQQTHERVQQHIDNVALHLNQKQSSNLSNEQQNNMHSNKNVSQDSSQKLLNQDPLKNETNFPQSDPASQSRSHHSSKTSKQQPIGESSSGVRHTNSQFTDQEASGLHSFQFPLSGFPNYFDQYTNNGPFVEHLGQSTSEPGETHSIEEPSVMDLEEILSTLFLTYWRRFYNMYTRSAPQATTPADWDVEEEVTSPTFIPASPLEQVTVPELLESNFTSADPNTTPFPNNFTEANQHGQSTLKHSGDPKI